MERSAIPQRISRVLHWLGDITSRASAALVVAFVLLVYLIVLAINRFPGKWQVGFSTVAESITLVMLFVIQHTQSRQQIVLQLKLDELIRSSPQADDLLVHLEGAEDAELIEREESQVAHHESLRETDPDQK
ncbi:MAG TPA: low affinity iron permease family protein [Acidimicrobiales bacterium]|nr:low affinity iron permease family protein [Acidimicrobiales bacterium]